MNSQQWTKSWFTLVELIVVITIIAILGTVGFISYSNYLTTARDSNRISQLVRISDALQIYSTRNMLPLPENAVTITGSWTIVAYQWDLGEGVLQTIEYSTTARDPRDNSLYTYYVTVDRESFQLLAFMEEAGSLQALVVSEGWVSGSAWSIIWKLGSILWVWDLSANLGNRFPKSYGSKLWVLTNSENVPIQRLSIPWNTLDIVNTTDEYVGHLSDNERIEGDGNELAYLVPNYNCKRIKELRGSVTSGVYTIVPRGNTLQVYCDMETDWGGWILLWSSGRESWWVNFWWSQSTWTIWNNNLPYSLWSPELLEEVWFEQIMIIWLNEQFKKVIWIKFNVNSDFFNRDSSDRTSTSWCRVLFDEELNEEEKNLPNCFSFWQWWRFNNTSSFQFWHSWTSASSGLSRTGFSIPNPSETYGVWNWLHWEIYIK